MFLDFEGDFYALGPALKAKKAGGGGGAEQGVAGGKVSGHVGGSFAGRQPLHEIEAVFENDFFGVGREIEVEFELIATWIGDQGHGDCDRNKDSDVYWAAGGRAGGAAHNQIEEPAFVGAGRMKIQERSRSGKINLPVQAPFVG